MAKEILQLARGDLACYAMALWPRFELAAHHRLTVEQLEAVERGDFRRLMMSCRPVTGKAYSEPRFLPLGTWDVTLTGRSLPPAMARNWPTTSDVRCGTW